MIKCNRKKERRESESESESENERDREIKKEAVFKSSCKSRDA